ncbi:GntR family transcriptional regulator [Polymorphospora sp. NPDC050346]|uniref:FadR/GntR family transcriptional regulator n=1 Tax=Polymorphospora sp. NPDC050346 TaxID=3155780 RepID=UPI0033E2FEBF
MALVPVPRGPISDHVFAQLRDAIVSGGYRPDDALPSERDLAATFEVNRHAVREALRRLQQLGLVRVSQGGATRVLDWREHAGLDLILSLPGSGGALPVGTLGRDLLEMRACVGVDAARLCAERGTARARAAVRDAVDGYADLAPDLPGMAMANTTLWRRIVEGSGNTAYLLAFNSLVGAGAVPPQWRAAELLDVARHRRLAASIVAGQGRSAARLARELLTAPVADPATSRQVSRA